MTNYEKYKDVIIKILFNKGGIREDKKTEDSHGCNL